MNKQKIINCAKLEIEQMLRETFSTLDFDKLTPENAEKMIIALKETVSHAGRKALKCYIEHFDIETDSIVVNEQKCLNKGKSEKTMLSPFGEISFSRSLYQASRGGPAHIPLDAMWGMTGEYATIDVREAICFATALAPRNEVEQIFQKSSLFQPSSSTIKRITERVGEVFEENEAMMRTAIHKEEEIPDNTKALVVSMDGVNVLLREEGSKKRRPSERPYGKKENDERSTTTYKNAMVGSISYYGIEKDEEDRDRPERIQSIYTSRMPESYATKFKIEFEDEIRSILMNPESSELQKICICDAHTSIQNYIKKNALYKDFLFLVDFYHVTEHLSKAAEAIFGKKSEEGEKWYNEKYRQLLFEKNGANKVLRSMIYFLNTTELSQKRKEELLSQITYFRNHKKLMNYSECIANGFPIGSGPIEAAAKNLVKSRLCRSGMSWSRVGGQKILRLRTMIKSNRWDNAWKLYKKCA